MRLNFKQLEIFRTIMLAKTISGAAEILHLSQPAVSRALKYTEHTLGIQLFERIKCRLVPTPEAEELFKELGPVYAQMEGLESTIDRIVQNKDRPIRIGCTPTLSQYILPKLIAETKKFVPDVVIKVDVLSNEELADYLTINKGDFAVSLYDPLHPLITAEESISSDIVCIVPKEHRLAEKAKVALTELKEYQWILYHADSALGQVAEQLFKKANIEPKVSVLLRYNDDACSMVQHGAGISLVSDFVLMGESYPKLHAIQLSETKQFQVHTLRHSAIPMPHKTRLFYKKFTELLTTLKSEKR